MAVTVEGTKARWGRVGLSKHNCPSIVFIGLTMTHVSAVLGHLQVIS